MNTSAFQSDLPQSHVVSMKLDCLMALSLWQRSSLDVAETALLGTPTIMQPGQNGTPSKHKRGPPPDRQLQLT